MIKKKLWFMPKIILLYLFFTIFLYYFGPYKWPTQNKNLFIFYIFLVSILLYLGFFVSIKLKKRIIIENKEINKKFIWLIKICIILNFVYSLWAIISYTGIDGFSIANIIDNFSKGLSDPGEQYYNKFGNQVEAFGISTSLTVIFSPITYSASPLFLYNYKNFSFIFKIFALLSIVLEAIRWISIGTNQGLITLAFIFLTVFFIKSTRSKILHFSEKTEVRSIINKIKSLFYKLLLFLFVIFGISYFVNSINDRISSAQYLQYGGIYPNMNNWMIRYVPSFVKNAVIFITSYLTQGYYALSIALPIKNELMNGIGNSNFLISNFSELYNQDFFNDTYQMKISQFGWNPYQNYHTFYMWIANDVGFIGNLIVIFLLGLYFGFVLKKAILEENPICIVLLSLLLTMFFYFPANNVVLATPNTFIAFWGLSLLLIIQYLTKKIRLK